MTTRPRVVVSMTASVDGRITLSRAERLLDAEVSERWREAFPPDAEALLARREAFIEQRHRPAVSLNGSGNFVADDAGPADLPAADAAADDFVPHHRPRWFAVVDGRGRVGWTYKGDAETGLLVLACGSTPGSYLAFLRREEIPYLLAGAARVDLPAALVKLREHLGAECVVSEGGGGLNGALLRAGLVDELHVVTVPALVGGLATPSIVDGPPLAVGAGPVRLRTVDVTVGEHGTVWAHYERA